MVWVGGRESVMLKGEGRREGGREGWREKRGNEKEWGESVCVGASFDRTRHPTSAVDGFESACFQEITIDVTSQQFLPEQRV